MKVITKGAASKRTALFWGQSEKQERNFCWAERFGLVNVTGLGC
jgi:hypothetical protein